jgi:hypothetical protein
MTTTTIGNLGGAVCRRLRMFVFGSRVSEDSDQLAERTRTVTGDLCGRAATSPDPVSK